MDDTVDNCNCRYTDVKHLVNFEDYGKVNQLGKDRIAFDYWLSFAGPGELFETCLDINKKRGIDTWAKIQVCSSHEISTVPYVPVPGLLYEKYKYMYENGIDGVMQCWFFGNYPCLMSKAAEILSFDRTYSSKKEFLSEFARLYYSETDAPFAERAWECFERAYRQYPINVMFSYYGPMHDGVVWELALLPKNYSLSRSWLLLDPTPVVLL
jgi:hypothetical protein